MKKNEEKTNVIRILEQNKINFKVYNYINSTAISGSEVADYLGEDYNIVFKTLVTIGKSGNHYVFLVPVNKELDLKKAAVVVKEKSIEMIKSKELLPLTGYIHGGCSPVGMKKNFTTINDIDFTTQKIIDEIYNTSDTMDRIILGYSQYLDYLENMINNMISYQLNMIMKTLTEISIVLTIPAMIFGFWGINVHVPFEKSSYGVLAVLIISAILSLICWFLLRRKTYL